jgi:transcriptional regulator GlxA family with amidase domain
MRRFEIEPAVAASPGRPNCGAEDWPGTAGLRNGEAARRIEESIAYMREHLDQPLQAATLAARANLSLSHFFALFKQRTGGTPIDYFIRLRMRRACELLAETTLAVKEVAASLGYEDPFYFSRVFKSVNAVAPTEYRFARQRLERVTAPVEREMAAGQTAALPGRT